MISKDTLDRDLWGAAIIHPREGCRVIFDAPSLAYVTGHPFSEAWTNVEGAVYDIMVGGLEDIVEDGLKTFFKTK